MWAKPEKRIHIIYLIVPYKEEIALNMSFKAAVIFTVQFMLSVFCRKTNLIFQQVKDIIQRLVWTYFNYFWKNSSCLRKNS